MSLEQIAKYYDLIHGQLVEDVPMWERLTEEIDASILEIGCGTGRLLLPLAQAGHTLTGIDLSEVALRSARAKLEAAYLAHHVSLHQVDMRDFELSHKDFAAALLPLNTFMHCHSQAEQVATLQAIHGHLQPDGILIVDLFYPDPLMLAEVDGRLYFEAETVDHRSGHAIQWYWRHDIDLANQMRHLTYILDEVDAGGQVRRITLPFSLRFVYRFEMELLLAMSGFVVDTIFGSYDLEPFDSHSSRMIFVARKQ
jgi:SAM-dependent methyltransferase